MGRVDGYASKIKGPLNKNERTTGISLSSTVISRGSAFCRESGPESDERREHLPHRLCVSQGRFLSPAASGAARFVIGAWVRFVFDQTRR